MRAYDHADYDILSEHRHGEDGANPSRRYDNPRIFGIVKHVVNVDDPALNHCPPRRRSAALRDRVLLCRLADFGRGPVDGCSAIELAIWPGDHARVSAGQLDGALYQTV